MVVLAGRAGDDAEAERMVREALASGAALAKFEAIIARQGGDAAVVRDPSLLPRAAHVRPVTRRLRRVSDERSMPSWSAARRCCSAPGAIASRR